MPGIPPGICCVFTFSSGISVITAPVVSITPAVDAAAAIGITGDLNIHPVTGLHLADSHHLTDVDRIANNNNR